MKRKSIAWWGAGVAVAIAVGWFVFHTPSGRADVDPGPRPMIPGVDGVPENGPIPPIFDDGDPAIAVGRVGSDWTSFYVDSNPGEYYEWLRVDVGETGSVGGVTIALCAVWYNPGGDGEQRDDNVGAPLINPSRAYFIVSRDGSTPVCP